MKNNDLDLDILENADGKTVERLSECYRAVPDSDISRLFGKAEQLYKNRTAENDGDYAAAVSGVEVYRRPVWKKVLTFAAALVLIGSAVTGSAIFYKNNFYHMRDGGGSSSGSIEDFIGSTEEIPYENFLENGRFKASYESFTYESNPLQISGAPYPDAAVAKPFKSVLVDKDSVVAPVNVWHFPVVCEGQYVGFVNCDMRCLFGHDISFWGGQLYAPKLNKALEKGSIAIFDTLDGTYGIYEDNTVIELQTFVPYSGNITFEQVNQGNNLVTADSASDMICDKNGILWENIVSPPGEFFEQPTIPDEIKGKNIIDMHPMYEFAYDYTKTENNAANADNIIIGTVDSISYKTITFEHGGTAYTQINVTVSEDIAGKIKSGETVSIIMAGGYISMRDFYGDTMYKTGGKYGDGINMTEEEIDNTVYHEIVDSGEVPIAGMEYAFFTADNGDGNYASCGMEYGILLKYGNVYVQRNSDGYSYYTLKELKAMM